MVYKFPQGVPLDKPQALALQVIEEYKSGGGNNDVEDAEKSFDEADDLRTDGKHKDAVAKYKDALSKVS